MSKFKIIHVIPQWYLVSGRVLQSSAAAADIWISLIYIFCITDFGFDFNLELTYFMSYLSNI